jgi:hypothetical protein
MRAWAVKPGGEVVNLIDIPAWDFRWQDIYSFRSPVHLPAGTVVYGEATYDNTTSNPNLPGDAPQWVFLGEATTDEMMLFYFAWTYGFPSDESIVIDDGAHAPHYLDCEVEFNVSVNEQQRSLTAAWPVPARHSLFVQVPGRGDAVLLDMTGRQVAAYPLVGPVNELDISSVVRGTYLLQVRELGGSGVHHIKVVLE